jgi:hypothetical protein
MLLRDIYYSDLYKVKYIIYYGEKNYPTPLIPTSYSERGEGSYRLAMCPQNCAL